MGSELGHPAGVQLHVGASACGDDGHATALVRVVVLQVLVAMLPTLSPNGSGREIAVDAEHARRGDGVLDLSELLELVVVRHVPTTRLSRRMNPASLHIRR